MLTLGRALGPFGEFRSGSRRTGMAFRSRRSDRVIAQDQRCVKLLASSSPAMGFGSGVTGVANFYVRFAGGLVEGSPRGVGEVAEASAATPHSSTANTQSCMTGA